MTPAVESSGLGRRYGNAAQMIQGAPSETAHRAGGLRQRIVYHPTDRYPWFQLIEMGLLLTASGAMALFIRWRISRHLV